MKSIQNVLKALSLAGCLLVAVPLPTARVSGSPPSSPPVAPIFRPILPQLAQAHFPVYLPSWLPVFTHRVYPVARLQGQGLNFAGVDSGSHSNITAFPIPTAKSMPSSIARGPDGNLWFTEWTNNKIGRITPSGRITQFAIPTAGATATAITGGTDGAVWFIEEGSNKLGRITPSGKVREYPLPGNRGRGGSPRVLVRGPDGNLWFTDPETNSTVRWIVPTTTR